jgi:hypothetical protein
MIKTFGMLLVLALAGCAVGVPPDPPSASPCAKDPGSYDCQVERYMRAP